MADERKKLPLIDIASVVIAPALVMLMVGSLVFFLIEVLQTGRFEGRLHYTFFFFVFGAVLIARVSIQFGFKRAAMYGIGLGGACFVAMMAFVEYQAGIFKVLGPLINIGLMALVWWSAHKLTWDCTHLDDNQKASGRGVLAAAGLDSTPSTTTGSEAEDYDPDRSRQVLKKKSKQPKEYPTLGIWERYQKYREWRKKKPHTPGVWVLYFAVGAIPLFALGQATIPADDATRRSDTFWQMAVYIGSALGLLVTTTLMGLRRYLEDRKATIPSAMTAAWLSLGLVLILAFVGIAAVLPRPHTETPLFSFQKGGKSDRKADKNAIVKDNSAGKGEGAAGQRKEAGDGKSNAKGGKEGGKGEGEKSKGQGGSKQGNNGGSQSKDGNKSTDGNKGNDGGKSGEKGNEKDDGKKGDSKDDKNEKGDSKEESGKSDGDNSDSDGNDGDKSSEAMKNISKAMEAASEVVKWIVWIALALLVLIGIAFFLMKYLSNFSGFAKNLLDWFRNLFGKKKEPKKPSVEAAALEEKELLRPPPFEEFSNPFRDGTAKGRDARELAEYSFAALDAWAWDRRAGREPDETPTEFAARLAEDHPELEEPARQLVNAYSRALFSPAALPKETKTQLAAFWQTLESLPT